MSDAGEWEMPSEAEMKVLVARRERSDKISKIMGQYLLKGYKMLDSCCPGCDNVMLQDKQGKDYCVACSEVDNTENKDNPAVSVTEAKKKVQEGMMGTAAGESSSQVGSSSTAAEVKAERSGKVPVVGATVKRHIVEVKKPKEEKIVTPAESTTPPALVVQPVANCCAHVAAAESDISWSIQQLMEDIKLSTEQLKASRDVDTKMKIVGYVKSCADAIKALRIIE